MKILCLHGRNQSGQILKTQLDAVIEVIEHAQTRVSFDFADAPIQCAGLSADGQQPGFQFFGAPVVSEIYEAHEWLKRKLHNDGPYDGVISYSQGAAVVSSYLLYQQWYDHEHGPPFRFATFIGGGISLAVLKDLGVPVPRAAEQVVQEAGLRREGHLGPLPSHAALARQALFNSDDCFGLNLNRVPHELKIRIPTAHVWGTDDPDFPTSTHLAGLCDPYIRKIYIHVGGHELPRGPEDTQELGQLVSWCMQRAIWPGCART